MKTLLLKGIQKFIGRSTPLGLAFMLAVGMFGIAATPTIGQELSAAEKMARKAQDPLGDVKAVMTDNTISFGAGDDDTDYAFQVQPVYSIPTDLGFNAILRAVVPIVGAEAGSVLPPLGPEQRQETDSKWGLGDIIGQLFLAPSGGQGNLKWGVGPQFSFKTRTSDRAAGPGWGAGFGAVVFGFAGNVAYGALASQHWGFDGDFSILTLQPIVMYNFKSLPGVYIGYNNSVTYDWKARSSNKWNVPLGLTAGRTFALGGGYGMDLSLGGYGMVVRPDNSPDWQIKFGVSLFFP